MVFLMIQLSFGCVLNLDLNMGFKEEKVKKRTLFFLSVCAVALNGYVVHADSLEAPSQLVTVPNLPGTGGQLTVVEEAGQMKAILSNITGEIVGVTGQFKSETNTGKTIAFTIDASGQYVAYLDRTSFSNEDQAFTLALTANLIDGSAHNLDDYSFNWVKVAENTNDDSDLIENTNATEASKPVSSGTVVDSVEKDSSSSASETQSSSTASSSLAATVTDSSNVTSASTLTSTQTTSSVGSQLRSASLMRIATNSSAQSSAVTKASQIDQTLELKYTGSINSGEVIKFAVWSDENGQDDIVWYNADQTGAAYADLRKHRDYGKYNIHTYVNRNGKMVYLNEIVVDVKASGTVTIENVNDAQGTFDVRVTNISSPKDIASVILPTWSQSDDLRWYEATRQSDGSYKLTVNKKDHQYRTGTYTVHLYYKDSSGGLTGAGGTTTVLSEDPVQRSYTVYIDPGHGGIDSGASYGGVYEKNLALSVANKLKANLIQLGYQVLMTRTADYNVDFKTERSKMANQSNADLFISIHFNATGLASSNATGIETYWYQYDPEYQPKINAAMHNDPTRLAESEILANQVQASLISGTGAVNRGVRRETFAVLRETAIPAILVELGFMDNPSDLQKIKQDSYQTKLANALAQGIDNWYGPVGGKPTSGTSTQKKSTEQSQMTTGQQSFFNNILPAIQQVSQKNSIVTSVMLAQSILESGWGTSQLATNAYNIFGIKADSSWKGNAYTVQTKEVVNEKTITVEKQFRAYKSLLESISDYGSFFTSTAWRKKNYASFLQATNYETALTSLLASGYATDPAYAEKLKSLIQRYGLNQYDLN